MITDKKTPVTPGGWVRLGLYVIAVLTGLAAVLAEGHLYGAVLDVTDPEPLPKNHPLRRMRNVVLTPHVAGLGFTTEETERKITAICCDNLRRYQNGWSLRNQVDFRTGYRRR